jgi:hypothetical protein
LANSSKELVETKVLMGTFETTGNVIKVINRSRGVEKTTAAVISETNQ